MLKNSRASPPADIIDLLKKARRVVVLTGAGMSAESGIPTFRDQGTGFWARFDPQTLATAEAFARDPGTVWAWYEWRRRLVAAAQPNAGHTGLVDLASLPWLEDFCIVTQNVDDLHERAGSKAVIHLHGSLFAPRCFKCGKPFEANLDAIPMAAEQEPTRLAPPSCNFCGGNVRPGVVWFGEALPETAWRKAIARVSNADLLLVIGTSGQVYPAASLPNAARQNGAKVAVINPDPAAATANDIHWQVAAAEGLPVLVQAVVGAQQDSSALPSNNQPDAA